MQPLANYHELVVICQEILRLNLSQPVPCDDVRFCRFRIHCTTYLERAKGQWRYIRLRENEGIIPDLNSKLPIPTAEGMMTDLMVNSFGLHLIGMGPVIDSSLRESIMATVLDPDGSLHHAHDVDSWWALAKAYRDAMQREAERNQWTLISLPLAA